MAGTKAWALRRTAQLVALEAIERGWPGRAAGTRTVPRSPAAITPEWLTGALFPGGAPDRVLSVSPVRGSTGTTTRRALRVTYREASDGLTYPRWLFVKCTTSLAQRLMLGLGGLIHGEPAFYAHIRPRLRIEAPLGYFGAVAERPWRSIVVLEDVAHTRGAVFWAPTTQITRDQMEDVLEQAAVWHGALWESPLPAAWRWLRSPADQMRVIDALIGLADRRPAGVERAREVIPASLRARQADLHTALRRSMEVVSRGPRTYLHGDLHAANTYLTGEGRMGICDWQVGLHGSWAHDVAYVMATALSTEDRRSWERELLSQYLGRLAAAGGPVLSEEEAWLCYRRALFYPYFAWVYTLGRSRLQPDFQPEQVSLTLVGRIARAIEDLDSLAAVGL